MYFALHRLIEQKIGALDQAAPLAGWDLPDTFITLRRLLEARMGKAGTLHTVTGTIGDEAYDRASAGIASAIDLIVVLAVRESLSSPGTMADEVFSRDSWSVSAMWAKE